MTTLDSSMVRPEARPDMVREGGGGSYKGREEGVRVTGLGGHRAWGWGRERKNEGFLPQGDLQRPRKGSVFCFRGNAEVQSESGGEVQERR